RLRLNAVARDLNDSPADVLIAWGCADTLPLQVFSQSVPSLPMVVWCWDASELFTPTVKLRAVRHLIASSQAIASRVPENAQIPITVIHPGVYSEETTACYDVDGQIPCLVSLDPLSNRPAY